MVCGFVGPLCDKGNIRIREGALMKQDTTQMEGQEAGKGDRPWAAVACEHGANAAKHAVPSRKFLARSAKLDLRSRRSFRKLHDAF